MTFDEAMHTPCGWCGQAAQMHRLTNAGNFYCLEPSRQNSYRKTLIQKMSTERQRMWAVRVKCNELRKSPLAKSIGKLINGELRGHVEPVEEPST
jgi:hypothetical protein